MPSLLVWAAFLLLAHSGIAQAQPPGDGTPLRIEPHITLAPILPSEISSSNLIVLPPLQTFARSSLDTLSQPTALIRGPRGGLGTLIEREIPELWELRVPISVPPQDLDVTYELRSSRGRPGHLSHLEHEGFNLRAQPRAIPPTVIRREGDRAVIQGGVVLVIDVTSTGLAGTYLGTLTTTVINL